jgi:DNA-binding CsgD family transcriptional regulator
MPDQGTQPSLYSAIGDAERWIALHDRAGGNGNGCVEGDALAALQDRLVRLAHAHVMCLAALETVPFPIIIVDGTTVPVFVHRRAQTALALADGIILTASGLVADDRERTHALRRGIVDAVEGKRRTSLLLPRRSNKPDFIVVISPLHLLSTLNGGIAAVLLIDPEAGFELDEAALRNLYGLTRAEGRLVSVLVRGRTLEEAANELCVSLSTVKTHLQRVFLKTDTSRQAQLLRRLLVGHLQID